MAKAVASNTYCHIHDWSRVFDVVEEMHIDFCFYISPFPSTMSTARQPHAAALPLNSYFYGPLRGRRTIQSSR